jgi:hypothetical protein
VPACGVSVTGSYPARNPSTPPRCAAPSARASAPRRRATGPGRDGRRRRLPDGQAIHVVRKIFSPFSALPRGGSVGAGLTAFQIRQQLPRLVIERVAAAPAASVFAMPSLMVLNKPGSVATRRPHLRDCGPAHGHAHPLPWHSAAAGPDRPMPVRIASRIALDRILLAADPARATEHSPSSASRRRIVSGERRDMMSGPVGVG